jgi:hypothetical protein
LLCPLLGRNLINAKPLTRCWGKPNQIFDDAVFVLASDRVCALHTMPYLIYEWVTTADVILFQLFEWLEGLHVKVIKLKVSVLLKLIFNLNKITRFTNQT